MLGLKKVLAAAAIAACASTGAIAQDKGTFKIVTHSPLSGPQSPSGEAIKLGAQLALEDFAKLAPGFKLVLQPEDDQAKPDVGVANANRIINDNDVIGVVGHYNSGVAIPSSEVYAKVNLAMVSPANTNPTVTERASTKAVANRVCGRDDVIGPAAAEFAVQNLGAKKVYVINDKTAYGQGVADAFEKAIKKMGVTVALSTGIDEKETDFSTILNRAAVEKPQVIFYGGIYTQGGLLIKQMRQKKVDAAWLAGDGVDSADLQKIAGAENMVKTYFVTAGVPLGKLPEAQNFAKTYKAKFNKEPEGYSAYAYDAMHAMIQAIADASKAKGGAKPGRADVAAAVRKVSFKGLTGDIAFTEAGDIKLAKYAVVQANASADKNDVVSVLRIAAPTK